MTTSTMYTMNFRRHTARRVRLKQRQVASRARYYRDKLVAEYLGLPFDFENHPSVTVFDEDRDYYAVISDQYLGDDDGRGGFLLFADSDEPEERVCGEYYIPYEDIAYCDRHGNHILMEDSYYDEDTGQTLCTDCYEDLQEEREQEMMREVDTWVRDDLPDEDEIEWATDNLLERFPWMRDAPNLRIGPEIEVSEGDSDSVEIAPEAAGWSCDEDGTEGVYCEYTPNEDNELTGVRGLAQLMSFHDMLESSNHETDSTCGGHVHLDIDCLPESMKQAARDRFEYRWALLEDVVYRTFRYPSCRDAFARPLYHTDIAKAEALDMNFAKRGRSRYTSIHHTSKTIEVRAAESWIGDRAIVWAYFLMRLLCDTEEQFPTTEEGSSVSQRYRNATKSARHWLLSELPSEVIETLGVVVPSEEVVVG